MASPIIQVDNLNWQVEQKPILKQISFSLGAGKILGVIGPNGAGKTTLLRCIYGRISNFSGQIQIKHKSNLSYGGRALALQIAVVSQQTEINGALTVEDIVAMGMLPHKSLFSRYSDHDNHQIFNAITNVGLAEKAKQTFSSLSGGEQQRVLIARALVQGADVLILDEPTNHLDVYFQHQILQLITNLPLTIIMTVHDLNLASHYCDQLLLLKQGELVAFGNNEQVLTPENLSAVFQLPCQIEQNHIRFYPAGSN